MEVISSLLARIGNPAVDPRCIPLAYDAAAGEVAAAAAASALNLTASSAPTTPLALFASLSSSVAGCRHALSSWDALWHYAYLRFGDMPIIVGASACAADFHDVFHAAVANSAQRRPLAHAPHTLTHHCRARARARARARTRPCAAFFFVNFFAYLALGWIFYVFEKKRLFANHRLQPGRWPSDAEYAKCLRRILLTYIVLILPVSLALCPQLINLGITANRPVDDFLSYAAKIAFCWVCEDAAQYAFHRFLHAKVRSECECACVSVVSLTGSARVVFYFARSSSTSTCTRFITSIRRRLRSRPPTRTRPKSRFSASARFSGAFAQCTGVRFAAHAKTHRFFFEWRAQPLALAAAPLHVHVVDFPAAV